MENLSFNGYPVTMCMIGLEVYVTCKNVTGTLSQAEEFLFSKKSKRFYFGECRIRDYGNKGIRIDCLHDTKENFVNIYNKAKELKEQTLNIN